MGSVSPLGEPASLTSRPLTQLGVSCLSVHTGCGPSEDRRPSFSQRERASLGTIPPSWVSCFSAGFLSFSSQRCLPRASPVPSIVFQCEAQLSSCAACCRVPDKPCTERKEDTCHSYSLPPPHLPGPQCPHVIRQSAPLYTSCVRASPVHPFSFFHKSFARSWVSAPLRLIRSEPSSDAFCCRQG